jgi:hypothetical protein
MVSFKGIATVMGWGALATWLYSSTFLKVRHWQKSVVKESSHEWWERGAQEAHEDFSQK